MDHSVAIKIFEDIQRRPYRLALEPDQPAQNCYFKGVELLQKLGILGYGVRGRVAETYWDAEIFGIEAVSLIPDDLTVTHFFVEVLIDGQWRLLDPSFQPNLKQYGLTIGGWDSNQSCFPLTKIYTQEESLNYQLQWSDETHRDDFFNKGLPAWKAIDAWFKDKA